jgi:hypothetical protein
VLVVVTVKSKDDKKGETVGGQAGVRWKHTQFLPDGISLQ